MVADAILHGVNLQEEAEANLAKTARLVRGESLIVVNGDFKGDKPQIWTNVAAAECVRIVAVKQVNAGGKENPGLKAVLPPTPSGGVR